MNTWMRVFALVLGFVLSLGGRQIWHQISPTQEKSAQMPQQPVHEAQEIASAQVEQQAIDFTEPGNQPYRPARMELFQQESTFEIVGTDVTPGTQLHWVLVNRKGKHDMIFRALLGDSRSFGPIERGRIVRLGQIYFWSNPGHEGNIVVVLAIE